MKGSTRGGGGGGGGREIVHVKGGHILRSSTTRKDRHSKIYTSKGPKDRRVRLSAHTAIQFYDVQDRLGYDRPTKAVDWLIHKAKSALDKLNGDSVLPPDWQLPHDMNLAAVAHDHDSSDQLLPFQQKSAETVPYYGSYPLILQPNLNIMKPFFPTSSTSFPDFRNDHDSMPRASFQGQDLGLSLQQGSCQRMDGWDNDVDMNSNRVGSFVMNTNSQEICQQHGLLFSQERQELPFFERELLQSNLASATNRQFELGFGIPDDRNYGEEEPQTHQ